MAICTLVDNVAVYPVKLKPFVLTAPQRQNTIRSVGELWRGQGLTSRKEMGGGQEHEGRGACQEWSSQRVWSDVQHADGHVVYEFEPACHLGAKLAGVHWWFKSRVHAAELTAGYYNTRERDGYADLMAVLKKHSARLSFTCVEMRDCEHPPEGRCSPEGAHPHPTTYPLPGG